jgi:hypothetical protein
MSEVFIFVAGMIAPAFLSAVFTLFKCLEEAIKKQGEVMLEEIDSRIREAVLAEREACARICDEEHTNPKHYLAVGEAKWIAVLIRNRGKE